MASLVGAPPKLHQAIGEIHKRDWDKSSVPRVQPKDRRNGINFPCPEAVVMVANIDKHLAFINANLRSVTSAGLFLNTCAQR